MLVRCIVKKEIILFEVAGSKGIKKCHSDISLVVLFGIKLDSYYITLIKI